MTPLLDRVHAAFLALLPPLASTPVDSATVSVAATVDPATGPPLSADAPAKVALTVPPLPPPSPCQIVNAATKGYHLDVAACPERVVAAAELLDREGFAIDTVTGVDWIAANEMEVVYDFFHPREPLHVVVRTRLPRANPEVPTISRVFPGANWHERETHEFFGIKFLGHPNLTPFLLPEDATYHPLRKDFVNA